jgi:hypothetical protein
MTSVSDPSESRALNWSLTLGGAICLALGVLVFLKSRQPLGFRSFILLVALALLPLGLSGLGASHYPRLASGLKVVGKVFIGFALFSLSWALSHP